LQSTTKPTQTQPYVYPVTHADIKTLAILYRNDARMSSSRAAFLERNLEYLLPVVDPSGHVLTVLLPCGCDEIEHLHRRLLVGEMSPLADSPTEPGVQRLGVGRIEPELASGTVDCEVEVAGLVDVGDLAACAVLDAGLAVWAVLGDERDPVSLA
jgi:hypothetical protein